VAGIRFAKGHGTQNDFVVISDPDASMDLTDKRVQALCDRRRGFGADGVLRVAPTIKSGEVSDQADSAEWFMDYRNADNSAAQMCGNGARVFARFLLDEGLVTGDEFSIATRGGTREVTVDGDTISVEMGPAIPRSDLDGAIVSAGGSSWPLLAVEFPNPHAVVFVADLGESGPLVEAPLIDPPTAFPEGVNVEFAVAIDTDLIAFRVFERGIGETASCGTGACAVAWAYRRTQPDVDPSTPLRLEVAGGQLKAWRRADEHWVLSGPTEIVARGEISDAWWRTHR
jgi:diaminopimelate epimerase